MPTGGIAGVGPFRTGGSRGGALESILNSLLSQKGTAYDTGTGTAVWVECMAYARAIWSIWETARRMANQFDPWRMTDFLPRWEKIFRLHPLPTDTLNDRRTRVARRMALLGQDPNSQGVYDLLTAVMPNTYVGTVHTSSADATTHVTDGANVSGGISVPADGLWSSSVAYLALQVEQPVTQSAADFYREAAQIWAWLDDFLPSWVTFNWFRDVGGEPGFVLDTTPNLDNQRLGDWIPIAAGDTLTDYPLLPYYLDKSNLGSVNRKYVQYYRFTVSGSGDYTITLTSTDFDPYLYLLRDGTSDGGVLDQDDNSGGGTTAEIVRVGGSTLAPGNYMIVVTHANAIVAGTSPGAFTLAVTSP